VRAPGPHQARRGGGLGHLPGSGGGALGVSDAIDAAIHTDLPAHPPSGAPRMRVP